MVLTQGYFVFHVTKSGGTGLSQSVITDQGVYFIILLWADFLESTEYVFINCLTWNGYCKSEDNQYLVTFWSFKITCALLGVSIKNLKSTLFSLCSIAFFTKFWTEFYTLSMFTTLFRISTGVIPFAIIRKFWRQAFTMSKREK